LATNLIISAINILYGDPTMFGFLRSKYKLIKVFQYTSPACRNYLALHVQRFFFTPDETLLFEGDYLENIYLVISG